MKEKIVTRLVSVKSIVTLTLTVTFAYLAVIGKIDADAFLQVFMIVIGFYFGVQTVKDKGGDEQ